MAAISCDMCNQEPAVMMQSVLANGETIAVGDQCMITFFAGALQGMITQLDDTQREAFMSVLSAVADAIGLLPADELPSQPLAPAGALADDGISGNESAGALTAADIEQLEAADTANETGAS